MSDEEDARFATIGRVAAEITHDLVNLLVIEELSIHALRRASVAPSLVDPIEHAHAKIMLLAERLLDHVRGSAPLPVPLDLAARAEETIALFARTIPRDIDLRLDLQPGLPSVRAVPIEIDRILLNLIVNARDAMAGGGTLVVTVRSGGAGFVELEVCDTGPSGSPRGSGRTGTGLGLGIVRAAAASARATFSLSSRSGTGTRAIVRFPIDETGA